MCQSKIPIPVIIINGRRLTDEQSEAIYHAVGDYVDDIKQHGRAASEVDVARLLLSLAEVKERMNTPSN